MACDAGRIVREDAEWNIRTNEYGQTVPMGDLRNILVYLSAYSLRVKPSTAFQQYILMARLPQFQRNALRKVEEILRIIFLLDLH